MPLDRLKEQSSSDNIQRNSADDKNTALSAINTKKERYELRQNNWTEASDGGADAKGFVSPLMKVRIHG